MNIPKSHPRAKSLKIREKLVSGFESGIVAKEGLIAHGRGETFDYLLGEKTTKNAKQAIKKASLVLLSAKNPVISINGNTAALCLRELIQLSKLIDGKLEVNLFYKNNSRKKKIINLLKKEKVKNIFGIDSTNIKKIPGLKSNRKFSDRDGIISADVVFVPLEDGDRTIFLKKMGKKVITFDLNPLSRTAQTADITIIDEITRGISLLNKECKKNKKKKPLKFSFNNKKNLEESILEINTNLKRRAKNA